LRKLSGRGTPCFRNITTSPWILDITFQGLTCLMRRG
jgi:hypothetical protein